MIWSTTKCKILQRTDQDNLTPFKLARQTLETVEKQAYLGATVSARGVKPDAAIHRIRGAVQLANTLQKLGFHGS